MISKRLCLTGLIFSLIWGAGCSSVQYLVHLGKGQLSLYNHERSFQQVLEDPKTDAKVKNKILEIIEIKKFVEKVLGVSATSNYTSYVNLNREKKDRHYVIWALTVAEAYQLKTVEWRFPFVGSFPYLGFFDSNYAKEWEEKYKNEGYDTYVRGVRAYSTLGYLKDPFLSSMLDQNAEELANMIFHETIHAHIFLKNHGAFNEQIASYFGDMGEKVWIEQKYGIHSEQMKKFNLQKERSHKFTELLKIYEKKFKELYSNFAESSDDSKLIQKKQMYQQLQQDLKSLEPLHFNEAFIDSLNSNSALLALLTYEDYPEMQVKLEQKFGNNLKQALSFVQKFTMSYIDKPQELQTSGDKTPPQEVLLKFL